MRLALYHPWTYLRGGVERTLVELLSRSRHDWTLYTHHFRADRTFPELSDLPVQVLEPGVSVERRFSALANASLRIARTRLPEDGSKALLVSSEGLGDLLTLRSALPAVCFCHTPLKIVHDPATREGLARHNPRQAAALKVLAPAFRSVDRRAWERYEHVFANSAETASRIREAELAGEVEVLHPGVEVDRFDPGAPRRRTFLVAGRIMWQKHIELAIDAFVIARRAGMDADLVIAGAVDDKSRSYLESLRVRASGHAITFVTDPTDAELDRLYAECLALVFTPPNEDWGIVPLEAMAAGTPVLAIDAGGPRESVVPGETGWLLPPTPAAFALRMAAIAAAPELLEPMRSAARSRAAEFDWDRFVRRIDDVMEAVGTGGPVPQPQPVRRRERPVASGLEALLAGAAFGALSADAAR